MTDPAKRFATAILIYFGTLAAAAALILASLEIQSCNRAKECWPYAVESDGGCASRFRND